MALIWRDPASRIVAGAPADTDFFAWWMRYMASEVAHWRLPALVTVGMNAPTGVSAMWNPSLLAQGIALAPVTWLAGPQVSLNVLLTAGFAGSATSMFWVLRRWSCEVMAAGFGGLAYGFSPALTHAAIGHYHIQFAVLPPLIVHALLRLPRDPVRYGAWLGLLAALQLLISEEILFNTGVAVLILLAAGVISRARALRLTEWAAEAAMSVASGLLVAGGVFTLVAGYPLWTQFFGPLAEHGSPFAIDFYKNDLVGFVRPSSLQLIHSAASAAFARRFGAGLAEYLGYLGWPMLLILTWAAVALWRVMPVRLLAVTFFTLEVLSLGGTLLYNGHAHGWIKLPWYWIQELPVAVSVISDRFSVIADGCAAAMLAFALDAARGQAQLREGAQRGSGAVSRFAAARGPLVTRVATFLTGLAAVLPMLPAPLPTMTLHEDPPVGWARAITDLRLPYGASALVLPVPGWAYSAPLRWQADTGMPSAMVGGYFIGPGGGGEAYVGGSGLSAPAKYLNWLWLKSDTELEPPPMLESSPKVVSPLQVKAWAISAGLSAVVAVTSADSPLAHYLDHMFGHPAAQSGTVIAWRVQRLSPRSGCLYDDPMIARATEVPGSGVVSERAEWDRRPRVRHELAIAGGCYLIAAIVVLIFVWRDPASRIVKGGPGDPDQAAWWMRYAASEIAHWRLPALVTSGMNAPAGVSVMWNPSLLAPGVALSLVTLLAGPQVSLTVMLTAGFAGSATSMFWVLRRWSCALVPAALGGLAYGFSPALSQSAIGHYDLQFAVLPPLIVHALLRLPRDPVRCGAWLGLLAALQLLTAEELLFGTGIAVLALLAMLGLSRLRLRRDASPTAGGSARRSEPVSAASSGQESRAGPQRFPGDLSAQPGVTAGSPEGGGSGGLVCTPQEMLSGLMVAGSVFLLVAGYPLWTQFRGPLAQHGNPYVIDFYKNDLSGLIHPSSVQLIHSGPTAAFAARFAGNPAEYLAYLGWPMLLILAWAAVALWRMLPVRLLAVTFIVLEVFSLGGTLLYNGQVHGWIKLPWYWLQELPVASSAIPDRFSIIADGCAAALLAFALDAAWREAQRRQARGNGARRGPLAARIAICLTGVIAVVPLLPAPLPAAGLDGVPAGWAQALAGLRLPYGASVLALPVPSGNFTAPLRWQADTGMPSAMVGGYFIGPARGGEAYVGGPGLPAAAKYLNWMWMDSGPGLEQAPPGLESMALAVPAGQVKAWIVSSGLSAVAAVTRADSPLAFYLDRMFGQPAAQSGGVIAWRVRAT
jgi:hypothetical protein